MNDNTAEIHYVSADGHPAMTVLSADAPDQLAARIVNYLADLRATTMRVSDVIIMVKGERWWYKYNARGLLANLIKLRKDEQWQS